MSSRYQLGSRKSSYQYKLTIGNLTYNMKLPNNDIINILMLNGAMYSRVITRRIKSMPSYINALLEHIENFVVIKEPERDA